MAIKVPESLSSNLFIVADNGHNEKMCSIPRLEKALPFMLKLANVSVACN